MALLHATLGRSGRAASAVRLYRQAVSEIRAGDDAALYRPPPDTHAGAVRTYELPCGDRRSGTGVEIKKDDNIIYKMVVNLNVLCLIGNVLHFFGFRPTLDYTLK